MTYQCVESLSHAQREKLVYIDFRLYFFGEIGRSDLTKRFGIAPAGATRELASYRALAPQNIQFDSSSKSYRITKKFAPLFKHESQHVLSALALGFGDSIDAELHPLLPCESPAILSSPKLDVLATLCRAINAKRPVSLRYYSMSSGESKRVIVPFALVDTGLRWHVRAFDRKRSEFRDFVVTRIQAPQLLEEEIRSTERPENDNQWTRIVELELVPHPRLAYPEIIQMDYAMQGGSILIQVRAAVAGYMLQRWRVDSSPDHCLKGSEYRLWLKDHLALYGVKNALLAPGYKDPYPNEVPANY